MGTGRQRQRREIETHVKCSKACANLGNELSVALVVGWQHNVWYIGLEDGEGDKSETGERTQYMKQKRRKCLYNTRSTSISTLGLQSVSVESRERIIEMLTKREQR